MMTRHINLTPDDLTKPDPPTELCDLIAEKVAEFQRDLDAAMERHPSNACDDCGRTSPDECAKCSRAVRPNLRLIDGGGDR